MIQRKQTIFLALVVVVFIVLIFIPVYQVNPIGNLAAQVNGNLIFIPTLLIPMAAICLIALLAIFSFKNRPRQIKMCRVGLILSMLIAVNAILFPQFFIHGLPKGSIQITNGAFLLPINIVLFAIAAFFIKKDEDLVKAADRLR